MGDRPLKGVERDLSDISVVISLSERKGDFALIQYPLWCLKLFQDKRNGWNRLLSIAQPKRMPKSPPSSVASVRRVGMA